MYSVKSTDLLNEVVEFRNKVFTQDILLSGQRAYQRMMAEKIVKDLRNTSRAATIEIIDHLLAIKSEQEAQSYLEKQNPNLIAFVFLRVNHAIHVFEDRTDVLQFENPSVFALRSLLVDLFDEAEDSSDRY